MLSQQLSAEFGRRFSRRNLFHMMRFAEVFPHPQIVHSLIAQLGWPHFLHGIRLDEPLKRDFYAEMSRIERWNTRTLDKKIQSMLFERTARARLAAQRHDADANALIETQDRIIKSRALPRGKR
jgi:hypothetical protein